MNAITEMPYPTQTKDFETAYLNTRELLNQAVPQGKYTHLNVLDVTTCSSWSLWVSLVEKALPIEYRVIYKASQYGNSKHFVSNGMYLAALEKMFAENSDFALGMLEHPYTWQYHKVDYLNI